MPTFVLDIILKTIFAAVLIDFGFVHSSELTVGMTSYHSLPHSATNNIGWKQQHNSPLISYQAQEKTGYYKFGYAAADGQYRVEEGSPHDGILGSYGYIGTDGKDVKVFYKADSQGFQILTADVYKALSNAKQRYQYQAGPSNPNVVQPGQNNYFYRNAQEPAKDIEETDTAEVVNKNKHAVLSVSEDDSMTKQTTGTPDIVLNEYLPIEHTLNTGNVQHQQPPLVFNQNMYPDRIPYSFPVFFPSTIKNGFVNPIPAYYFPNIHNENSFVKHRFRFAPSEMQHIAPLIIRVK